MSNTRKTWIIVFMVSGSALVFFSFFAKLGHWSGMIYNALALAGFILATIGLILVMRKPKMD